MAGRIFLHPVTPVAWVALVLSTAGAGTPPGEMQWPAAEGFRVEVDTSGYQFPTRIAFVPEPGPAPGDPLYFVTELRGKIKVVTNDRTIIEFAAVPAYRPERELPDEQAEAGLAGLCLDPENGFVFVTYAGPDEQGILRNFLVRYETRPGTFSTRPSGSRILAPIISREHSGLSHQIGPCRVHDNSLFVAIGDAGCPRTSQEPDRLLGKVLRLNLDGTPHPDNPYHPDDPGIVAAARGRPVDVEALRHVWAIGFRSPYGMVIREDGQVYIAENGPSLDRFVRVERGENYRWMGTDMSIGSRLDVAFPDPIGPTQAQFWDSPPRFILPEDCDSCFLLGACSVERAGVYAIPFCRNRREIYGVPVQLMSYQGPRLSLGHGIVGLAVGPDGFYVAPLLPDGDGETHIFRVTSDPNCGGSPKFSSMSSNPTSSGLLRRKGCLACHVHEKEGGLVGPRLDFQKGGIRRHQLVSRLNSKSYREYLSSLDELESEPFLSTADERKAVRESRGVTQLRLYIRSKLLEPRFDNAAAHMPKLGLTEDEAERIADILLEEPSLGERVHAMLRSRKVVLTMGCVMGVTTMWFFQLVCGGAPHPRSSLLRRGLRTGEQESPGRKTS